MAPTDAPGNGVFLNWSEQDSCHTKDLGSRRGRLKFRECVRKEPWLYGLLAGHPEARAAVEDLLGPGEVAAPRYFRGLYPVFPCDPSREKRHLPGNLQENHWLLQQAGGGRGRDGGIRGWLGRFSRAFGRTERSSGSLTPFGHRYKV